MRTPTSNLAYGSSWIGEEMLTCWPCCLRVFVCLIFMLIIVFLCHHEQWHSQSSHRDFARTISAGKDLVKSWILFGSMLECDPWVELNWMCFKYINFLALNGYLRWIDDAFRHQYRCYRYCWSWGVDALVLGLTALYWYMQVRKRTAGVNSYYGSHVMQYGDLKLSLDTLYLYMGTNPANPNFTLLNENSLWPSSKAVNQRDADLLHFWHKVCQIESLF